VRTIRVFPEYQAYPLWVRDGDGIAENTDPADLPISPGLVADLMAWSDRFDAIFEPEPSSSSAFASPAEDQQFYLDGQALAARLTAELGAGHTVTYEYRPS
jgi:hypothetical protein